MGKKFFYLFPWLANANGRNTAPSGVFLYPLRSNLAKSTEREGLVSANSITVPWDKPRVRSVSDLTPDSHPKYLCNLVGVSVSGTPPFKQPSYLWVLSNGHTINSEAIADLYEFNDLY